MYAGYSEPESASAASGAEEMDPVVSRRWRLPRILVIEDDAEVRDYLVSVLSRAGHEVFSASDGSHGVAVFRENRVELVITDIIMPTKDGIETILDLRRDNPSLKVIAISGGGRLAPDDYLNSAKLLGADLAIKKPFSNEDMLSAVNQLLGGAVL
jgi:DNA-binding response OmpR family regulator